jgi:hypothetical protein
MLWATGRLNRTARWLCAILLLAAGSAVHAARGRGLAPADVPEPVRQTIEREKRNARIRRIQKTIRLGKDVYEVEGIAFVDEDLDMTIAADGTLLSKLWEYGYGVARGRLTMGNRAVWIRTLQTPKAGDPSSPPDVLMRSIYRVSDVGGNTLVFDLYGLGDEGKTLSKASRDHVLGIISVLGADRTGGMVRVLGPDAPKDAAGRMAAVRTVAETFKAYPEMVYWIDGPEAASLAAEFKKTAPELVVAAPGADLDVVDSLPDTKPEKPTLIAGTIRPLPESGFHYVLPDTPENFAALDEAKAYPSETEPWTPDNSVPSKEEREEGFVALFDGKTLDGWIPINPRTNSFAAKDGAIEWVRRGGGALQSRNRYGDFVLRLEYKMKQGANSGVQVRCPRANRASKMGFEVQLLGDYGRRPSKSSTGAIYDVIAPTVNASRPEGEWNTLEIRADGPRVQVTLNGQQVQDVNFDEHEKLRPRLRRGFIRLTDHGNYVAYRNIRIKEL